MYFRVDEDTMIVHIEVGSTASLCGLQIGWTIKGAVPVKPRYGTTCAGCQEELKELKQLRLKHHENNFQ